MHGKHLPELISICSSISSKTFQNFNKSDTISLNMMDLNHVKMSLIVQDYLAWYDESWQLTAIFLKLVPKSLSGTCLRIHHCRFPGISISDNLMK